MISTLPASPADLSQIDLLLDAGFGTARRGRTAYRLREGALPIAALSFVARDGDALVGSLQCWPIQLRNAAGVAPLVLLGPVAVAAAAQGQGVGTRLITAALTAADASAAPPMLLIGDALYYGRFGFSAAATGGWELPGPVERHRLLLRGAGLPAMGTIEARGAVHRVP